jgi:hypothetical protein
MTYGRYVLPAPQLADRAPQSRLENDACGHAAPILSENVQPSC